MPPRKNNPLGGDFNIRKITLSTHRPNTYYTIAGLQGSKILSPPGMRTLVLGIVWWAGHEPIQYVEFTK